MAKYTIHNSVGTFMGSQSTSKKKMIEECDSLNFYAYVAEEYIAPSPFDGKPSKHGRKIHENKIVTS